MHRRTIGLAAFLIASAAAADESSPPPAWMVRGFEAAIEDPIAEVDAIELGFSNWLLAGIPPGRRADEVIGKLLPLLGRDRNVQRAAAKALAAIGRGGRADKVIGKLLPLLGPSDTNVQGGRQRRCGGWDRAGAPTR